LYQGGESTQTYKSLWQTWGTFLGEISSSPGGIDFTTEILMIDYLVSLFTGTQTQDMPRGG
jgi:hypothetical protein